MVKVNEADSYCESVWGGNDSTISYIAKNMILQNKYAP